MRPGTTGALCPPSPQVDKQETDKASVETVDAHLDMLRGAINGLGGRVQVVRVEGDACVCR